MYENYILAHQALDMALGRGGDQAAMKTQNGYEFYGGLDRDNALARRYVLRQYSRIKKRAESLRAAGIKADEAEYCERCCAGIEENFLN